MSKGATRAVTGHMASMASVFADKGDPLYTRWEQERDFPLAHRRGSDIPLSEREIAFESVQRRLREILKTGTTATLVTFKTKDARHNIKATVSVVPTSKARAEVARLRKHPFFLSIDTEVIARPPEQDFKPPQPGWTPDPDFDQYFAPRMKARPVVKPEPIRPETSRAMLLRRLVNLTRGSANTMKGPGK